MADFTFSNKSGSSNFAANGDKNNEIFGDLLLNRTELEAYLTSLRRRQRSASPPANPNTGDIWECSTTGGGYTADVVYRYNGSAWAEATAAAMNIPNRNTVLQGKVDASGNLALFEAGTGLAVKLNATATPAVFAFMNGNSANTGAVDLIASVNADAASFWSDLPTSSTVYLYVDYTTGTVSGGFTTLAPVYQAYAPDHAAGLHWFDFNTGKVFSSDGSTWTQRNRICVGTATTDTTQVTAVSIYPYNVLRTNITGHASLDLALTGGTMSGLLNLAKGNDVASASTVNLSTATGNTVHITGTTGISAFTMTSGQVIDVIFDGALTLTHHTTNNNLPSAANITTVAGDRARYFYDGTTVYCLQYQRSNGTALVGGVLAGQVVQVQSVLKDTTFSGSSGSWTDITGLSVAITPSSTANKVLVTANVSARGGQQNVIARLMRDTTAIAVSTGQTNNATFQFNDSEEAPTCSITFLDSPASTSAVTYKMQYKCPSGGSFNLNSLGNLGMVSGITVQEVKG